MSGLLPSESEVAQEDPSDVDSEDSDGGDDEDVRVLWLDDDDADDLIGSLSSETARSLLTALHQEPLTASELSDSVDTSVQNVRHHLENLQDAGLVRIAGTRYSVKGREMNVYEPADDSLVVCVGGGTEDRSALIDSLKGIVGVAALLGVASLLVQWLFGLAVGGIETPGSVPRVPNDPGTTTGPLVGLLDPGVAFLAGGLLVLVAVVAVEYRRRS